MQYVPLPIMNLLRPTFCPMTLPQIMSLALTADFKKYTLAFALNELCSSEKDDKKSQNAETNIYSVSLDDIMLGKHQAKEIEAAEKIEKRQDSVQNSLKGQQQVQNLLSKKRQSYQKARSQITQALESFHESEGKQQKQNSEEGEDQISQKDKLPNINQSIKVIAVKKQKKIKKGKRVIKGFEKTQEQPLCHISTTVSLIDTIDHPRISIDRFEIQRKKQNLLARAIVYDEFEQRKFSYQIRERRQLKKLN